MASKLLADSALPLLSWQIPEPSRQSDPHTFRIPNRCSPSGRLLLERESLSSYRLTDLFFGNTLSIQSPELGDGLRYMPLSEFDGILYDHRKFMRAKLDIQRRRIVAESEEELPNRCREFFRLSGDKFACICRDGNTILVRQLDKADESQMWIRIQYDPLFEPITLCQHSDRLFVLTDDWNNPLKSYSLNKNQWDDLEIPDFEFMDYETMKLRIEWHNEKLILADFVTGPNWRLRVVDPIGRSVTVWNIPPPMDNHMPASGPESRSKPECRIFAVDLGLIAVISDYDRDYDEYRYRSYWLGNPLSLGLLSHFALLRSGLVFGDLPANDPIAPMFGPNRYRFNAEEQRKRKQLMEQRETKRMEIENVKAAIQRRTEKAADSLRRRYAR